MFDGTRLEFGYNPFFMVGAGIGSIPVEFGK
jgi:hypothetical protein